MTREVHLRRETRKERRDDFQRQNLLDLQDALQRFVRGIGKAVHFDTLAAKAHEGQQFLLPDGVSDEIFNAQVLTKKLASRVQDDEIRRQIDQVIALGIDATMPGATTATEATNRLGQIAQAAQHRMGEQIRAL
jgi:hypothetical protein